MTSDYAALLDDLTSSSALKLVWRPAFEAAPRHLFIPSQVWDDDLKPVLREEDPHRWMELVYADEALATQVEDGHDLPGIEPWLVSSSASKPSIVAIMLDRLDVQAGHRVLEIGTGTGWNAALLSARLGDDHVVTIEIDPAVADHARKALFVAGFSPTVITGDGTLGYPDSTPYDRVIATASVQRVPYEWVAQTNAGGRIITPWGTPYDNGALLELDVHRDGTASGHFSDNTIAFMSLREQRAARGAVDDVVHRDHDYTQRMSKLHPWEPIGTPNGSFAIGLRVPHCKSITVPDDDGANNHFVAYLLDPGSGSWASVHLQPHVTDRVPVRQHGPRRLWDEIEAAHAWWAAAGKPSFDRFGVTVQEEKQWVWLDVPERIVRA